jgi:hypothetical protein
VRLAPSQAEAFATTAASELARGGYTVVTEAGEVVLDVTPFHRQSGHHGA